jgi:hypothetical protein
VIISFSIGVWLGLAVRIKEDFHHDKRFFYFFLNASEGCVSQQGACRIAKSAVFRPTADWHRIVSCQARQRKAN